MVDTRKTLPGLRIARNTPSAAAVAATTGWPYGMPSLIKENHILAAGGIRRSLEEAAAPPPGRRALQIRPDRGGKPRRTRRRPAAGATMILLDNFALDLLRQAARRTGGGPSSKPRATSPSTPSAPSRETGVDRDFGG